MPDAQNDQFAIKMRRKSVADRYLRGDSQWQIARSLEIGQATVSRDLKAIQAEWVASSQTAVAERKATELAKLDVLERSYWNAWEESRKPKTMTSKKRRTVGANESSEALLREEMRDGNPRFLEGVERCIKTRLQVFGLLEVEGSGGQATVITVIGGIDLAVVAGQRPGFIGGKIEPLKIEQPPSADADH